MSAAELAPGKWDFEKSENFDEYMKALGVGMAMRLIGSKARPSQEISIVDDLWTIKTSTPLKNTQIQFKLDVPFEEQTADGRKVKTTCSVSGNKLIQEQKGDISSTIIREFSKENFVMTLKAVDVVCTRYYKKSQ
ncbi:sodium/calcium exchanger regulatory protein 1-like [Physella acuta]|uniref:sodium/calcium exchanger regulatory protein 1-like n=1 Tax=Physella acuta TaxID=109671 RepID=UPI0027DACC6A|nr:sodium/calcium exchanger regulatory protein 1-like [Physella acuta]